MGMYTQIHFGTRLKKDTPDQVVETLRYMVGDRDEIPSPLPDHELFQLGGRWRFMLRCDSYYFHYKPIHLLELDNISHQWWFNVTSNLKNYDGEIEKFIDWIMPWCDEEEGEFLGYHRYEEDQTPTVIYKGRVTQLCPPQDAPWPS